MSERYEQAAAEADRITLYSEDRNYRHLFMEGVDWADANPRPRTITLSQSEAILEAGRTGRYEDHEAALRAAGIEVGDE